MIKSSTSNYENQDRRSLIKNISSRMKNLAIKGAGLSKWEADVLIEVIEEVYDIRVTPPHCYLRY